MLCDSLDARRFANRGKADIGFYKCIIIYIGFEIFQKKEKKMGTKKSARVFEHEHIGGVLSMKLERLVNSGVGECNTEH